MRYPVPCILVSNVLLGYFRTQKNIALHIIIIIFLLLSMCFKKGKVYQFWIWIWLFYFLKFIILGLPWMVGTAIWCMSRLFHWNKCTCYNHPLWVQLNRVCIRLHSKNNCLQCMPFLSTFSLPTFSMFPISMPVFLKPGFLFRANLLKCLPFQCLPF